MEIVTRSFTPLPFPPEERLRFILTLFALSFVEFSKKEGGAHTHKKMLKRKWYTTEVQTVVNV